MSVQIKGSGTIGGIDEGLNITGVTTATNFKTGVSNLHSTGLTLTGGQLDIGSNIKLGNAGVITATSYRGDGSQLTGISVDSTKIETGNTKVETIDTGSDGHIKFTTEGSERLRIDSSGRVLIGTVSYGDGAADDLTIATTGTTGITIRSGSSNRGQIFFSRATSGTGQYEGSISYQHSTDSLQFSTDHTERLRINSSGHVVPGADSTYDLGLTGTRFRNVYADNLYGSGANLTSLPSSPPPNNFLINGAMQVNVRGTNHQTLGSFNPVTSSIYTLDRWKVLNENSFDTDSAKVVQDNTAPTSEGFRNSIMMNIGNTETPSSNHICGFQQKIEAQNLQSLAYGTSSAKTMTLSFWVLSNKTGTYCVQIMQDDVNKYVLYEYTISSSNTWEKKTITIAGNTSDAINNDNGIGLEVNWTLCVGSGRQASATSSWTSGGYYVATSNQVNLWDHPDNYFKMTGCQLQTGSTATDFVHEDIGTTLRKCQRYFYMACGPDGGGYETIGTGMIYYSGTGYANVYFPTTMRTQPSIVALSGSSGAYMYQTLLSNTAAYTHQIAIDTGKTSLNSATVSCACPSSRAGEAFRLSAHFSHDANGGQSFVNFDAEL